MKIKKPILMIEDDHVDVLAMHRAVKKLTLPNEIQVANDGENAIQLLKNGMRPAFIILDLNLPKMDGVEFLKIIKKDPELRAIPVIVLTTSTDDHDKQSCFDLGVAGYIVKPVDYSEFIEIFRIIYKYWSVSLLPE